MRHLRPARTSFATRSSRPASFYRQASISRLDKPRAGPVSRVTLDQFVYVGEMNGQKMTVNLVRGVFRFTTGKLDKNA